MPNDPTLHQFRALVLFAQQRYQESAEVLYAVLAVSQGWDGATVARLYDSPERYFAQSHDLEQVVALNPEVMSIRFLLAYHYVLQGNFEDAKTLLSSVYLSNTNDLVVRNFLIALRNS